MRICFNYIFIFMLEQRYVNAYVRVWNSKLITSLLQHVCNFTGIDSQIVALQCFVLFFCFFHLYWNTDTDVRRTQSSRSNKLFIYFIWNSQWNVIRSRHFRLPLVTVVGSNPVVWAISIIVDFFVAEQQQQQQQQRDRGRHFTFCTIDRSSM